MTSSMLLTAPRSVAIRGLCPQRVVEHGAAVASRVTAAADGAALDVAISRFLAHVDGPETLRHVQMSMQ
jgi:hypothetical protein